MAARPLPRDAGALTKKSRGAEKCDSGSCSITEPRSESKDAYPLAVGQNRSIVSPHQSRCSLLAERYSTMGYKQTSEHRFGKASYHQIGLVRGQFGNVAMDRWLPFLKDTGFDGWEEASWELDLARCATEAGAEAYARERVDLAKKYGLEIFTVA